MQSLAAGAAAIAITCRRVVIVSPISQKMYLSANCTMRGADADVITPNVGLFTVTYSAGRDLRDSRR